MVWMNNCKNESRFWFRSNTSRVTKLWVVLVVACRIAHRPNQIGHRSEQVSTGSYNKLHFKICVRCNMNSTIRARFFEQKNILQNCLELFFCDSLVKCRKLYEKFRKIFDPERWSFDRSIDLKCAWNCTSVKISYFFLPKSTTQIVLVSANRARMRTL